MTASKPTTITLTGIGLGVLVLWLHNMVAWHPGWADSLLGVRLALVDCLVEYRRVSLCFELVLGLCLLLSLPRWARRMRGLQ